MNGNHQGSFGQSARLASIVAAVAFVAATWGVVASQPHGAPVAQAAAPASDFVYFPAQYVNQGTEIAEPVAQF